MTITGDDDDFGEVDDAKVFLWYKRLDNRVGRKKLFFYFGYF